MDVSKIVNDELCESNNLKDAYQMAIGRIKLEDVFTTTNLYISAMRCASGFRGRNDTQKFLKEPWLNCYKLRKSILEGSFKPKYYSVKHIMERGKVREIKPPTFESKIVQKSLCDWLIRPLLEPEMIYTSYASVKGRGTDKMYKDILRAVNSQVKNENSCVIMTDFKGYFSSINLSILKEMLSKRIQDERIVNLILSFSPDEVGLSLGNELSQIPASFFPTSIDRIIKKNISTGHYFRYMDDSLFITENFEEAQNMLKLFNSETNKLKLIVKAPKIVRIKNNFVFCKERYLFDKINNKYFRLCNRDILKREKRKLTLFKTK